MFKGKNTHIKDKPGPGPPKSSNCETDISNVKAILDKHARNMVEEVSDISALSARVSDFKRKVKVKKSLRLLDPAFAYPKRESGYKKL